MDRALVLFNPSSQSGRAAHRWAEIQALSKHLGLPLQRLDTLSGGRTRLQVADLLRDDRFHLLIGVGGDGTLTEIMQGIMLAKERYDLPLEKLPRFALVPLGTGNNVAKSLGIDPQRGIGNALQVAMHGKDMLIDLGKVDGIYFADAFTIGLDSLILTQRNLDREAVSRIPLIKNIVRDYFLYIISGLKKVFTHKTVEATILIDGEYYKFPDLYNLVVNNTKVYAGVFDFSKTSTVQVMQDGLLDLIFFVGRSDYLSKLIIAARMHPLDEKQVEKILVKHSRNMQGKSIVIHLARPVASQIDGEEYLTKERFEISVIPQALYVKAPQATNGR